MSINGILILPPPIKDTKKDGINDSPRSSKKIPATDNKTKLKKEVLFMRPRVLLKLNIKFLI